jgi:hypothetical protein
MEIFSKYDIDNDGKLTKTEVDRRERIMNIELKEEKLDSQKKMAWMSMFGMIAFTGILFTPLVSVERVDALGDLLGLFYMGQASVVGAYMGFTAYMNR